MRFSSLFCWLVLPSFPSFLECLLLFGAASFLLLLLWVRLLSLPLLLEGAALPSLSLGGVLGGATFSLLFCWVVPLGLLRWVVLRFTLSFCVALPSFSPFWWCCFLPFCCLGAALPPPPLGGAAFFLSFFVVLPSFPSFLE